MKNTIFLNKIFIVIILILSLTSCGSKKDNNKPKSETYATAQVAIGNGILFDFKGDYAVGVSAQKSKLTINFLDKQKGISISLSVLDSKDGIQQKSYTLSAKEMAEAESAAMATVELSPVHTDLFPKTFSSKFDLNDDVWNDGTGTVTITSIKGNRVAGTFSATIYSSDGDEARITKGKFKAKVDYEF